MQTSHLLCLLLCVATGSEGGEGKEKKKEQNNRLAEGIIRATELVLLSL